MSTIEQINDFAAFARSQAADDGSASIDDLYSQWRDRQCRDVDAAAVAASLSDLEAGERGQELGDFLSEFDQERRTS